MVNLSMPTSNRLVVLTGFEPFAGFKVNPSWEAVKRFEGKSLDAFKIKTFKVPLRYNEIKLIITGILDTEKPTAILSFGQSYRPTISLEKIAINLVDLSEASVSYNCGAHPKDEVLEPNSPAAHFTRLPLRRILEMLRKNSIPAEISYTTGTFGCNQIFYHLMEKIANDNLGIAAGFIHVPSLPIQTVQLQRKGKPQIPSMSLETTVKAVEIIVKATIADLLK